MPIPNPMQFYDMKYTEESGLLTGDAKIYNDQNYQILNDIVVLLNSISTTFVQNNLVTLNGINPPSFTTAEITALEPEVPRGTIWYNSDLLKLQFKADNGVIETITST